MLLFIVGTLATVICFVGYLSNVQPNIEVRKARRKVNEYGSIIVVIHWHMFNALAYGFLTFDVFVTATAGVGLISSLFYLLTLHTYGADAISMEYTLLSFYLFALFFFCVYTFLLPADYGFLSVQILNITSNLACSVFLLQPIVVSVQKKFSFHPVQYTYVNTANVLLWALYGYLKEDIVLFFPSLVQGILRLIMCWQIYCYRHSAADGRHVIPTIGSMANIQYDVSMDFDRDVPVVGRTISSQSSLMAEEADCTFDCRYIEDDDVDV
ncbi:hypothetical protein GEMRC1_002781 [Eukaryota sp. GEM-RC1]